jgi:hypothetical protein
MQRAIRTTNCNNCDKLVMFDATFPVENEQPFFCQICHGPYCKNCFEDHISDEWWINIKVVAS